MRDLLQQVERLGQEQARKDEQLKNLQRSLNDKDALLRVANQRAEGLQRSLNGLHIQMQEANQSLNFKDAQLQEASRLAASLRSDLKRQQRDTQSLQQDVRDMRFLLSDAEARIAEGRQGIQESDVLRIASRDIHLTDNKLGHGSYGGLVRPLTRLSLLGDA